MNRVPEQDTLFLDLPELPEDSDFDLSLWGKGPYPPRLHIRNTHLLS